MKKFLITTLLLISTNLVLTQAWAAFPTTGVLYSANAAYCVGVTITTTVGTVYTFTTSPANVTTGATYTNNGHTYTALITISTFNNPGTTITMSGSGGAPTASGTLTKASGTGDSTITFSSKTSTATGLTGGTLVATGSGCAQDTVLYVNGGTNGTFLINTVTGDAAATISLNSPGTGFTAGAGQSTFVPLSTSVFTQFGTFPLTVVNRQIVGTASGSGAYWNTSFTTPEAYATIYTASAANGNDVYIYAAYTNATNNGYRVQYDRQASTDNFTLNKVTGGSGSNIGSTYHPNGSTHAVNGDSYGLQAIGGVVSLYYRNVDKFTVTAANATKGDIYQDGNGVNYTIATTIAGATTLTVFSFSSLATYAGTLTKQSGSGDATIAFSAFTKGSWSAVETASDSSYTTGIIGMFMNYTGASPGLVNFGGGFPVAVNDFVELIANTFSGQSSTGIFAPGGSFTMTSTVKAINGTSTTVTGTLTSSDSCVTITAPTETFSASLAANATASNATPFAFTIASNCASGHLINLTMTLSGTSTPAFTGQGITIPILVNIPSVPVIAPTYTCLTNYYVSMYGQDGDTGVSIGHAWQTMTNALNTLYNQSATQPGVCVNVEAGTYTIIGGTYIAGNYIYGLGGVAYGVAPSSSQYFVVRSDTFHLATFIPDVATEATNQAAADFTFDNANAVAIDGFNLAGINSTAGTFENGVSINSYLATVPGSYITEINNLVHDHGGVGLGCVHTDYCVVEGNIVWGNALTSIYQQSGISEYQSVAVNNTAGYHNIIAYNISFNNYIGSGVVGNHTDGNGIIIDDFQNTQNGSAFGVYAPATLIKENLIFGNGGGGVHTFLSNNITVMNNTTYGNFTDLLNSGTQGRNEINTSTGINNTFVNNIAYATPNAANVTQYNIACGDVSFFPTANSGTVWYNNVCYNGTVGATATQFINTASTIDSTHNNILGINPNFTSVSTYNFNVSSAYPSRNGGTSTYGYPTSDLSGRAIGVTTIPIGAFQYSSSSQSGWDIY